MYQFYLQQQSIYMPQNLSMLQKSSNQKSVFFFVFNIFVNLIELDWMTDHFLLQVNHSGQIQPFRLASQIVRFVRKKFGRSWSTNFEDHKYFLLPSSVMEIVACSSSPGMKLLIFKVFVIKRFFKVS